MSGAGRRRSRDGQWGRPMFARTSRGRQPRATILVVCEGEKTERTYLDQLKREDSANEHFAVTVKSAGGRSRTQIVQEAADRMHNSDEPFDEVWCVMDVEQSQGNPEHLDDLRRALLLARKNGIVVYLSNPAFEVWLLAHFERTARPFNNCDAVISSLNKQWRERFRRDYEKGDMQIYCRLAPQRDEAVENAQWVRETHHRGKADTVDCNSSTDFYKLVRRLLTPSGN